MLKKSILFNALLFAFPAHALESSPLAAVSALSYIGGVIVDLAQGNKPRHKRTKVGQAMQAAGAVGLVTSAFLAASESEPDVCHYHGHYHPHYRHHYTCPYHQCRFYRPAPVFIQPYYYPRPHYSFSVGYRFR